MPKIDEEVKGPVAKARSDGYAKELCVSILERTMRALIEYRRRPGSKIGECPYDELIINTVNSCDFLREAMSK